MRVCAATAVESPDEARCCPVPPRAGCPRRRADARLSAENRAPVHAVHAAERAARDPSRGSQRADGQREHVVPRRLRARAHRPHRLRAPVRAPDVHGLGPRQAGRVRPVARSGRRRQQRLDLERPDQLLDQRAGELARARAVPRVRSHGLSPRHDDAQDRRCPARRREERAAPVGREPALRHGRGRARRDALSAGPSVSLAGHRLHGRPHRRELRRRGGVLQEVLRARPTPASSWPATSRPRPRAA